jgi:hypothetical protein
VVRDGVEPLSAQLAGVQQLAETLQGSADRVSELADRLPGGGTRRRRALRDGAS